MTILTSGYTPKPLPKRRIRAYVEKNCCPCGNVVPPSPIIVNFRKIDANPWWAQPIYKPES